MFSTIFYNPVYNLVVFLSNYIVDAGLVIIAATIIIKLILFPLFNRQINTQIATKKAKPELDALKEKYNGKEKDQRQEMAMEMMAIYKKYDLKPFTAIFLLIIQIPILLALYWIFYKGGLPEINTDILYSFVKVPAEISMSLLGVFDLAVVSPVLALVAGVTQFMHMAVSMPDVKFSDLKNKTGSMKEDMGTSIQVNLKYGLPVFIFVILATVLNSAVAIYWITSNIFMTVQEYFVRHKKAEIKVIDQKNKKEQKGLSDKKKKNKK